MNRFNKFLTVTCSCFLILLFNIISAPSAHAALPIITVDHESYLDPNQSLLPITLTVGPYRGTQLDQFLPFGITFKAYFANRPEHQSMLNVSNVPFNQWTPVNLTSGQTTIDLDALGIQPGKSSNFYVVAFASINGNLHPIAMSDSRKPLSITRVEFPATLNPNDRIATTWTATKQLGLTKIIKSFILPVEFHQADNKKIVIQPKNSNKPPVIAQVASWAKYQDEANSDRQLRVSYVEDYSGDPGTSLGHASDVYLVDAGQVGEPSCAVTPQVTNFLNNGYINFTMEGMRPGESYQARFTSEDLRGVLSGSFPVDSNGEILENGSVVTEFRLRKIMQPNGPGETHLPNFGTIALYGKLTCGTGTLEISPVLYAGATVDIVNRQVLPSNGSFVVRKFTMAVPSLYIAAVDPHLYTPPPGGNEQFNGVGLYRYGSQQVVSGEKVLNLFQEGNAHLVQTGMYHPGGRFVLAPIGSNLAYAQDLADDNSYAAVVHTGNTNDSNWGRFEVAPGAGVPSLMDKPVNVRMNAMDRIWSQNGRYPFRDTGGDNMYGLHTLGDPSKSPFNYVGTTSGSESGDGDIETISRDYIMLFNSKDTGNKFFDYAEIAAAVADGYLRRDNISLAFDARTGKQLKYEDLLAQLGRISWDEHHTINGRPYDHTNELVVKRDYRIDNGAIETGYSSYQPGQPNYRASNNTARRANWEQLNTYQSAVPYANAMNQFRPTNHQHALRSQAPAIMALALTANYYLRDYIIARAETAKSSTINTMFDAQGTHLFAYGQDVRSSLLEALSSPHQMSSGDRTREALIWLTYKYFLQGNTAVLPADRKEIIDVLKDTIALGLDPDTGYIGGRYNTSMCRYEEPPGSRQYINRSCFMGPETALAQRLLGPNATRWDIEISGHIQPYQQLLFGTVLLHFIRSLEGNENPGIREALTVFKLNLKESITKGVNYNNSTVQAVVDHGIVYPAYIYLFPIEVKYADGRKERLSKEIFTDPRYYITQPSFATFASYVRFLASYGVWNENVRNQLNSTFSVYNQIVNYMPPITDSNMALNLGEAPRLWAKQYLEAHGGPGGPQSNSSGNGGNFQEGFLNPVQFKNRVAY